MKNEFDIYREQSLICPALAGGEKERGRGKDRVEMFVYFWPVAAPVLSSETRAAGSSSSTSGRAASEIV